jgi:hypothetical protein
MLATFFHTSTQYTIRKTAIGRTVTCGAPRRWCAMGIYLWHIPCGAPGLYYYPWHTGNCGLGGMVCRKLLVAHPNVMRHGYMDYPWRITFRCATDIWTTSRCTMGIYITRGAPWVIYYQMTWYEWHMGDASWVVKFGTLGSLFFLVVTPCFTSSTLVYPTQYTRLRVQIFIGRRLYLRVSCIWVLTGLMGRDEN